MSPDRPDRLGPGTLKVLKFVLKYQAKHGRPPTHREIQRRLRLRSTQGVRYHLGRLSDAGLLFLHWNLNRGITPTCTLHRVGLP